MININALKMYLALAICILLSACSQEDKTISETSTSDTGPEHTLKLLTIATGGTSGVYHNLGTTLSDAYARALNISVKTQTTGGTIENINLMSSGKVEMAFVLGDSLYHAMEGTEPFTQKIDNINQLATIYTSVIQIATMQRTGIRTIEDLVGKRVAVGDQNSGTEINARALLKAHNISYQDINVDYLGFGEAADALKAGRIDAAFLSSGMPNAALLELAQGYDLAFVTINKETTEQIALEMPYFAPTIIPKNTYGNNDDIPAVSISNALIIRSDISVDDGYQLTKIFFESLPNLVNSHQAARDISLEKAQQSIIAPLHLGAKRYYDEQQK